MYLNKTNIGFLKLSLVVIFLSACGGGGGGATAPGTTTVLSAYVANYGDGTVSQYTINPNTGALTAKSPATICSMIVANSCNPSSLPTSVAVDPVGKHAYVANSFADISQFTIGQGGILQPINPATVPSGPYGNSPTSVVVDASGKYLYAVNSGGSEIAQFVIDPTTGALSPMSIQTVCLSNTQVQPCPLTYTSSYDYITIDHTGKYVYVADQTNNMIDEFQIGAGGGLTFVGNVATGINTSPISIAFDPADNNAYVVNYGNPPSVQSTITQYVMGASGVLGAPVTTGGAGTQLINATSIAIDPLGTYAYVASGPGLFQLAITPGTGALINPGTVAPILTGGTPQSVAIDPSGKFVFVANQYNSSSSTGSVSQFSIDNGGALSLPNQVNAGHQAYSITTAVSIQ